MGANDPQGMANLDPRCITDRIYVGLMGSDKIFSHCKSMGANDPQGMANLDPGAWLAGYTKYINCEPHGFK